MPPPDPLRAALPLLRPRLPRVVLAVVLGALSLGSALALAAVSAWLITRAWQMPPVLDLSIAVVAVRTFGISRGVLGYCERLVSHDTALRAAGSARSEIYRRLAHGPADVTARLHSGESARRCRRRCRRARRRPDPRRRADRRGGHPGHRRRHGARADLPGSSPRAGRMPADRRRAGTVAGRPGRTSTGRRCPSASFRSGHRRAHGPRPRIRAAGRRPVGRGRSREAEQRQRDWGHAVDRAAAPAAVAAAVPTAMSESA